jgi:muramoyltetrapeptide carboxypeptidase
MSRAGMRIGVVAPGSRIEPELSDSVLALASAAFGDAVEIVFHPQCHLAWGHFAGTDDARTAAFLDMANDETFGALWIGRGGYGACRIGVEVLAGLKPAARKKAYLGYSDAGALLGALYKAGCTRVAHGPVAADIKRVDGDAAVKRALRYLLDGSPDTLEASVSSDHRSAAYNIAILSQVLGTPLQPDLSAHVLMLEEVSEYMYRIDRYMFHITHDANIRTVAGIRLGRCSAIPENDPDFAQTEEEVARHWCAVAGIPFLGRADIGHDGANKVVPFGFGPR